MKFASSPAHCIAGMEEAMDASMSIASAATSFLKDIIPELSLEPWKRPENSLTAPFERPLNPLGRSETSCFRPFQGLERGSEDFSTPSVQLLKPTKLFCKEAATTPGFATAPCAAELGCRHAGRVLNAKQAQRGVALLEVKAEAPQKAFQEK